MKTETGHMIRCHFCGHHDVLVVAQCETCGVAKEEFSSQGWAVETIDGDKGIACPDCRTVNNLLTVVQESY